MPEQKVPKVSEMSQIVYHPGDQDAIPTDPDRALIDNEVKLSRNQKLRVCHTGSEDLEHDYEAAGRNTERTIVEVVATQEILDAYGIDNRPYTNDTYPNGLIGQVIKVPVDKDERILPFGDAKPNESDGWDWAGGSSSSARDEDLICPTDAFVTDNAQEIYTDLPGKMNGPVMNEDNYLTYSGANKNIPGDLEAETSSSSA